VGALARFAFEAITAASSLPRAGRRVAVRILLNQPRFTALEAVPLVVLLSGILSFLVISSSIGQLAGGRHRPDRQTHGRGDRARVAILTALAVVGRSGTAITAELATNTVMGEVQRWKGWVSTRSIRSCPVPGCMISVSVLIVLFDVVALYGGFVGASTADMSGSRYLSIVLESLTTQDVVLTILKGLSFGAIIGLLPSFQGLSCAAANRDPQVVIRGTWAPSC
jgi:phospholipid/cholesterol/gamma-HCH transport system permease protein